MPSELSIENQLISILGEEENQWRYRPDIKTEDDLWVSFRNHLNRLNAAILEDQALTDDEFNRVKVELARLTSSPFLASQWLRGENGVAQILMERDLGDTISLEVLRNKDIAGGTSAYEVVNQIVPNTERSTRGDVTLLINGLPIIHIELKKESAKDGYMQAFHQIQRYAEDGFFKGIYATTQLLLCRTKSIPVILRDQVWTMQLLSNVWKSFCLIGEQRIMSLYQTFLILRGQFCVFQMPTN